MIEFREPLLLLLALFAIPLFIVMLRPVGRMRFSGFDIWPVRGRSFRSVTSFVPSLLIVLAYVSLCVSLAGPRIPGGEVREHREGIAMMLVVDKSGSMDFLDMSTDEKEMTRLDAVKEVLNEFVRGNGDSLPGRYNDSIGLISYGTFPDSDCPITLDHISLMQIVKDIQLAQDYEGNTAMGDALALAGERLRETPAKSKVIILLSDGVNNTGYEAPLDAARMVKQLGIKVYTIGVGTNGMALRKVPGLFGGMTKRQFPVEIDEKTLTEIADMTGGEYFRATDNDSLHAIYKKIDALEKTKISETRYLHYDEKYAGWVALAMALLALGLVLRVTYYRRTPW